MNVFAIQLFRLAAVCLLLGGFGCRHIDASKAAPLKTPPKGLAPMKRVGSAPTGGDHPELF